jgi:hypothetical protein
VVYRLGADFTSDAVYHALLRRLFWTRAHGTRIRADFLFPEITQDGRTMNDDNDSRFSGFTEGPARRDGKSLDVWLHQWMNCRTSSAFCALWLTAWRMNRIGCRLSLVGVWISSRCRCNGWGLRAVRFRGQPRW